MALSLIAHKPHPFLLNVTPSLRLKPGASSFSSGLGFILRRPARFAGSTHLREVPAFGRLVTEVPVSAGVTSGRSSPTQKVAEGEENMNVRSHSMHKWCGISAHKVNAWAIHLISTINQHGFMGHL